MDKETFIRNFRVKVGVWNTQISTSDLKALIVDDPSSVSVKDVYIGERETLSSLLNSLDVDL